MYPRLETLWVRYTHPENGWYGDRERCDKYLMLGKAYKVAQLYDRGCTTYVQIAGMRRDDCKFNSVMFDFENDQMELISSDIAFHAPQYEAYWDRDII